MQLHCYYLDALGRVLTWDLPDEACPDAVTAQAGLLAGMSPEELAVGDPD